jgi:hypothetical protein
MPGTIMDGFPEFGDLVVWRLSSLGSRFVVDDTRDFWGGLVVFAGLGGLLRKERMGGPVLLRAWESCSVGYSGMATMVSFGLAKMVHRGGFWYTASMVYPRDLECEMVYCDLWCALQL